MENRRCLNASQRSLFAGCLQPAVALAALLFANCTSSGGGDDKAGGKGGGEGGEDGGGGTGGDDGAGGGGGVVMPPRVSRPVARSRPARFGACLKQSTGAR